MPRDHPDLGPTPNRQAGPFRLREVLYPPGARMAPHTHDHPSITLVLAGGLLESVGSNEDEATTLSVVVKPAGVRHADTFGPRGARTLQIAWREGTDLGDAGRTLGSGWSWSHLRRGVPEFLALARELRSSEAGPPRPDSSHPKSSHSSPSHLESRAWDVLAALAPDDRTARRRPPRNAPRWLRRVREELDDRIGDGVEVRELAAAAGLHPGSLTRAFRRHFGESVTGYRTRERLRRAVHALAHCEGSVSRVAHDTGFADHPHLCRCVRDATGLTPVQLRRALAHPR